MGLQKNGFCDIIVPIKAFLKGLDMDSFIFAVNAVLPIILMVSIGYVLKRIGFMDQSFAKMANKLVFRVFLPVMLFLNVYKIQNIGEMNFGYVIYALVALTVIFLIALPIVMILTPQKERRGVLLQAAFRSNYALIGIPLAQSLFGEEGVMVASLLSAVTIPLLNILAVVSLSVFREGAGKPNIRKIVREILHNPLIIGVVCGLLALAVRALFVNFDISFRLTNLTPVYKVMDYLSSMATPMALLVLGAQFEFSAVASMKKEIIAGVLMRAVIVPVIGLGAAYLFFFPTYFGGAHFASFVAMFATPVAVSSVPMAQEMESDAVLAGQLVVWTTIISAFSVFVCAWLLRMAGVFG